MSLCVWNRCPRASSSRRRLLEVVDLAVEDDLDRAILVADRLFAPFQIDDREPPMRQADPRLDPEPLGVRAAMGDRIAHRLQHGRIDRAVSVGVDDACNTTHLGPPNRKAGCAGGNRRIVLTEHPLTSLVQQRPSQGKRRVLRWLGSAIRCVVSAGRRSLARIKILVAEADHPGRGRPGRWRSRGLAL